MLKISFAIVFVSCLLLSRSASEKNNVCKNMFDYLTIDHNKNCWYNPDVGSSAQQLITRRGYPFESYDVITEDGYVNSVYRIPHNTTNQNITRQPILLRAGFSGSPSTFLSIGNRSLAFFLVNNGFDVWLSNRRGSANSKGHVRYNRSDEEFWDFSFHECGFYDIKAEINLIANKTRKSQKIILLGYSMGSTETYIYAILRKKHARRHVAGIVSLSPIAFMRYSGGLVAKLAIASKAIQKFLSKNKVNAFYNGWEVKEVKDTRVSFDALVLAKSLIMFITGYDPSQISAADLPVYLKNRPSSSSVKTLAHFAQEVNSGGRFQYYDYGPLKNLMLYNSTNPPLYNISQIEVPVHLFYGEGDLISNKRDVLRLYSKLTVKNKSLIGISQDKKIKFNHVDFTLAKDIKELLYEVLLKTINANLRG